MIVVGIDPSINCTGVCVFDTQNNSHIYYMIPSKCTKKMKEFKNKHINILPYNKEVTKDLQYSDKEYIKTRNLCVVSDYIKNILSVHHPDIVVMEGVSYGSSGSAALVDLSGLQFMLRYVFLNLGLKFKIVSPTTVKKEAIANGQADKSIIVDAWKKIDKNIRDVRDIKIDDLADSFFIAHLYDKN